MNIRLAASSDLAVVEKLLYQVAEIHRAGRPDIFKGGTKKYTAEELLAIFDNPETPVYLAVDEKDAVLGYAFCILRETKGSQLLFDRRELYIDDLCVDETCRGRHIGSALYRYVKEQASCMNCNAVTLNVWCLNDSAMAFYRALGMEPLKVVMEDRL
jgi:ribosomal protein S18 acetylase RimI-like enzyme